jgi:hypothetical protein
MLRTLLLAATALTSASALALAQGEVVEVSAWDGAMRVTDETAACNDAFKTLSNDRARFHPGFGEQPTSFTRFLPTGTERIRNSDFGQFNGTGNYDSSTIANGFFFLTPGMGSEDQTYNFTQSPPLVVENTPFVTLAGTLDNYRQIPGCTITLRGHFTRVDQETVVLPPPYGGGD